MEPCLDTLYRVLDALMGSMFPFLAALDDRIDELQDRARLDVTTF